MDTALEGLIDKIKKEGVLEAKKSSEEILSSAKKKAEEILASAKEEAQEIKDRAETQAEKVKISTQSVLTQAVRDTLLLVKEKITAELDKILKEETDKALTPEFTAGLISKIVDNWAQDKEQVEVLASEREKENLKNLLLAKLKDKIRDKIVIKAGRDISKGFRIGVEGGEVYYDFSGGAIAEILKELVNPLVRKILNGADV